MSKIILRRFTLTECSLAPIQSMVACALLMLMHCVPNVTRILFVTYSLARKVDKHLHSLRVLLKFSRKSNTFGEGLKLSTVLS